LKIRGTTGVLFLLLTLLLSACLPTTTAPPAPTSAPPTWTPAPTRTFPTPAPTSTPAPTATPAPLTPLGLVRRWEWSAGDILTAFLSRDLDGDGRPDIALASFDKKVYLLDAAGQEQWSFSAPGPVYSLDAADLDRDGHTEILVGSEDGALRALNAAGGLLWEVPLGGRVTAVAALDVDADGTPEVLAGARPGGVWALRGDGTVLWQKETPGAPTAFTIAGVLENRAVVMSTEEGAVVALDPAGVFLWRSPGGGYIRGLSPLESGLLVGDRAGRVRHLTMDGEVLLDAALGGPVPAVAPFDLDGDGSPEVLAAAAGAENVLVALDHAGSELWRTLTGRGVWALAFADLEGDGQPEVVAGTDGGEILVLDQWGRVRGQTFVPFRVHGLLALDLNGDGRDEVLARASNHLYAFAGSPTGDAGEQQPFVATLEGWPEDTPLLPAGEGQVVLMAVGDVMLGRDVETRALAYGAGFPFAPLTPLLQQADVATGNLEAGLTDAGTPLGKRFPLRAQPGLVSGLQEAGFDLLTLANNHILDFGLPGLSETLSVLGQAGIAAVGAGPQAYGPVILEVKGLRIAFLGRSQAIGQQEEVAWAEVGELRQAVAEARAQADVVVVHLHAGVEYSSHYDEAQRRLAEAAAEGGAALVIGHHPHAPQEVEWIGDTLVAYSLGDFVFDIDDHDVARDGAVLRVILSRQGVVGAEWIPVRIVDDVQPRPLAGEDGRAVVQPLSGP
jgi:poly-gamma-glutamate capsule biosynthesis protein CapA/YwtB (metallophosphatase superfamily)/outer membrane protein assembly factor BamB